MNDRRPPRKASPAAPPAAAPASSHDPALRAGMRLGAFEIDRIIARSASTVVYLATDHALAMQVAIQEYLPARLVRRGEDQRLQLLDAWHGDVATRGHRAFIDEARLLAHCEDPALVRVLQLFEANGTVYRVMPFYAGERLLDARTASGAAPDEAALRALLDALLGALAAIHQTGQVHGGITPANILLLSDGRPLLLGPGAAGLEIGSDLVTALMASLVPAPPAPGALDDATEGNEIGADLLAVADVARFCITGVWPAAEAPSRVREPLAEWLANRADASAALPAYSDALLSALDSTASPYLEDRPLHATQLREWLLRGAPRSRATTVPLVPAPVPVPASVPAPRPAPLLVAERAPIPEAAPTPEREAHEAHETHEVHEPAFSFAAENPRFSADPGEEAPSQAWGDPMTNDRAHWVPTSLTSQLSHRAAMQKRLRIALVGGGAAVLVAAVIAIVTGLWEPLPAPIALEPGVAIGEAARSATSGTLPEPAPPPVTDAADTALPASPTSPTARKPGRDAAVTGGPRANCAGKVDSALDRCMQLQCQGKRWSSHPQCLRLKEADRAE